MKINTGGSPTNIYMRARAYKNCGVTDWKYFTIPLNPVYGYYTIVYKSGSLQITADETRITNTESISTLKISNLKGKLIMQFTNVKNNFPIVAQSLPRGLYLAELTTNQRTEKLIFEVTK